MTTITRSRKPSMRTDAEAVALATRHLRLSLAVVAKFIARYPDLAATVGHDELEAEAFCALLRAARLFDPSKGYRFSTYAHITCWRGCIRLVSGQRRVGEPQAFMQLEGAGYRNGAAGRAADGAAVVAVPDKRAADPSRGVELRELYDRVMQLVPKEYAEVFKLHLEGWGHADIGRRFGFTRERSRQVCELVITKLRKDLRSEMSQWR